MDTFLRALVPPLYMDHIMYRLDKNYALRVSPGVEPCPFMGGRMYRTHANVQTGLESVAQRHLAGEVDRTNLIGLNPLSAGMFPRWGTNLLGVDPAMHKCTRIVGNQLLAGNTSLLEKEVFEFREILRIVDVPEKKQKIKTWWLRTLGRYLGLGDMGSQHALDLLQLQKNFVLKAIFLPSALSDLQTSTIKHFEKWLAYVMQKRNCSELEGQSVMEMLIFAGGLAVSALISTALDMRAHARRDAIDAFIYECARYEPPVGTYTVREKDGTLVFYSLFAALKDPAVWGPDAQHFRVRDLAMYEKFFLGFAEPVVSPTGNKLDDRVCPGKWLTISVLRQCVTLMLDESPTPR